MYVILIYIIIIFLLLIFGNKMVEGQESNKYSDKDLEDKYENIYGVRLTSDDIKKKQINITINHNISNEIKLTVYLIDKVEEIKNILSKNDKINIPLERMELIYKDLLLRDSYNLFEYGIDEDDIIDLEDSIKIISTYGVKRSKLFNAIYDEGEDEDYYEPYEKYLKEFLKYNKLKKVKSDKIYSHKISDLFKKSSKPFLKPYNKYQYLDDNLNEKLRKDSLDESDGDDLVGPSPYINSPELFDRIVQENNNNDNVDNVDNDICCNRTILNIENPKLIDDKINIFRHDLIYESSIYGDFKEINSNYYDYMESGDRIYDYLYSNMNNYKNPGSLSL